MPQRFLFSGLSFARVQHNSAAAPHEFRNGFIVRQLRKIIANLAIALFFTTATGLSSSVLAASDWETCSDAQDAKNDFWDEKIEACQKVIRREKDPERLAVAHFYMAENLGHSYYAFRRTSKTDPCDFDKESFSFQDERIMQSGICYGPELAPARQAFDYTLSYQVQRIAEPTTTDYDAVLAEYDKALSYDPGNEKIKKARADFVSIVQDRNDAIVASLNNAGRDEFRDQLARDEFNAVAKQAEGKFRDGDFKNAKAHLVRLIADPLFADQQATFRQNAYLMRGMARLQLNDPPGALADLTKSIEINPEWNAYFQRGLASAALRKPEDAAADFTRALETAPNDNSKAELLYQRALARYAAKNAVGALDDLNAAIAMKEIGVLYAARGELYLSRQDYKVAKADFDRALGLGLPDAARRAQVHLSRGAASGYLEDYDGAVADYAQVIGAADAPAAFRLKAQLSRALIHHLHRDTEKAMVDYDAFFAGAGEADERTRARAALIIDGLKRAGLYGGSGDQYDPALRGALAQCVADPACRF